MSTIWSKLTNLGGLITGTLGIGNGGTGQTTKAAAFDALSPMTTAGDVIYGGASGTGTRLAAGATGTLLHGGTTPSWSQIVNADVDPSAAIAGSKIVAATNAVSGVVTTSSQSFAGAKTFEGGIVTGTSGGTTTTLNVNGDAVVGNGSTGSRGLAIQGSTFSSLTLQDNSAANSCNVRNNISGTVMEFLTAGNVNLQVDYTGNVTIGRSASLAHQITNNTTTFATLLVNNSDTSSSSNALTAIRVRKGNNNNTTSQYYFETQYNNGSSTGGRLTGDGGTSMQISAPSDSRLKKNITTLVGELDNILKLKPVSFDLVANDAHVNAGFIAQDMNEVYPDSVDMDPDTGMLFIGGWSQTDARIVCALQELANQVSSLKARVEELEQRST